MVLGLFCDKRLEGSMHPFPFNLEIPNSARKGDMSSNDWKEAMPVKLGVGVN